MGRARWVTDRKDERRASGIRDPGRLRAQVGRDSRFKAVKPVEEADEDVAQ
jgi:hypothetical protein